MKLKVIVVATLLVILTGCEASDLTKARAKYQCKDLGGVYHINLYGSAFLCNDGTRLRKTREPLPKGWRVGDTK